mmetsp:Transcript_27095/g.23979  ORF Transcript_27095/g.23979 Transcript_27095/m.23979 type:complete len:120 (-) Transcript_27095:214-573(-)
MINYVKDLGDIIKEGYAHKESRIMKSWKKRWTVLTPRNIYTFKEKKKYVDPTEVISLHETLSVKAIEEGKKKNLVKIQTKRNVFFFSFDTAEEAQEWAVNMSKAMAKTCLLDNEDDITD